MRALREAVAGFRRSPLLASLSVGAIALSLLVIGLFGLLAHNIDLALADVEERVEVVGYLAEDAPSNGVQLAVEEIRSYPEVATVRHVTRVEALRNATTELPEFSDVFSDLETNPLPASIEVELSIGHRNAEDARAVAERLRSYGFVAEARYGQQWVQRIDVLRRVSGGAAAVLGGGFALVAALLIATAVRMSIVARGDAIFVMQSVGAKESYIRRPFILEGLGVGVLGGLLALLLTWGVYRAVNALLFSIAWLPVPWVAGGVAIGGLLGMLSAAYAVRKEVRPYRAA